MSEPTYPGTYDPPWMDSKYDNPVWNCEYCGQFRSVRSGGHKACDMIVDRELSGLDELHGV